MRTILIIASIFYFSSLAWALEPKDPCWELVSNPHKAIAEHLEGLEPKEAGLHFFEHFASGSTSDTKFSEEIDYIKWIVLSLNSIEINEFINRKNHLKNFLELTNELGNDYLWEKMESGKLKPSLLTLQDHMSALKKLVEIKRNKNINPCPSSRINNSITAAVNSVVFNVFWNLITQEEKVIKSFAENFLDWSKEEWFQDAFFELIKTLSVYWDSKIEFVKEKFSHLEERINGPKKIKQYFKENNLLKESGEISDSISLIYNNEGFESEHTEIDRENTFQGNKLDIEGIRTGYNIYFPNELTESTALIVCVYGGSPLQEKDKDYKPGKLSLSKLALLDKGMIIADLNLPDRYALNVPQASMDEMTHTIIHKAIDNFFQTISQDPRVLISGRIGEKQNRYMNLLKEMPKYIFGGSFGGRTAVRHIQLYPGTFMGAISHDGDLEKGTRNHLWPINYLDDTQKILVMQNIDDARVKVSVSTLFNLKAKEIKSKEVQIYLTQHGNVANLSRGLGALTLKGHFEPTLQEDFNNYIQRICNFIAGIPEAEEETKKQNELLLMVEKKNYLKNRTGVLWHILKETLFHHIKDKAQRTEIGRLIDSLEAKARRLAR